MPTSRHRKLTPWIDSDKRRLDLVIYGAAAGRCFAATLVSPLTRAGHAQPRFAESDGEAVRPAERRKHATYPELSVGDPQASWFWALRWAGGGTTARSDSCATSSVSTPSAPRQLSAALRRQLGRAGGVACWRCGGAASSCRHSAGTTEALAGNGRRRVPIRPRLGPAVAVGSRGGSPAVGRSGHRTTKTSVSRHKKVPRKTKNLEAYPHVCPLVIVNWNRHQQP